MSRPRRKITQEDELDDADNMPFLNTLSTQSAGPLVERPQKRAIAEIDFDEDDEFVFTALPSRKRRRAELLPSQYMVFGGLGDGDVKRPTMVAAFKGALRSNEPHPDFTIGSSAIKAHAPRRKREAVIPLDPALEAPNVKKAVVGSRSFYGSRSTHSAAAAGVKERRRLLERRIEDKQQAASVDPNRFSTPVNQVRPQAQSGMGSLASVNHLLTPPDDNSEPSIPSSPPLPSNRDLVETRLSRVIRRVTPPGHNFTSDPPPASSSPLPDSSPVLGSPIRAAPSQTTRDKKRDAKTATMRTTDLQALLPKRHAFSRGDQFDLPGSSELDETERVVMNSEDDELNYAHKKPRLNRGKHAQSNLATKGAADANQGKKRRITSDERKKQARLPLKEVPPNPKASSRKAKDTERKISQTYSRRQSNKENDEISGEHDGERSGAESGPPRIPAPSPRKTSDEMKAMNEKFKTVDEWTMEFEDATGHSSSMDFR